MILVSGHCCPDDVYFVHRYPVEDSTVGSKTDHNRCTKQSWERGGNSSNNATVLACLGSPVEYFGTLANDNLLKFLQDDMNSVGIIHDNCPIIECESAPISVVVCSEETGSRTIIHAKGDLRELTLEDFTTRLDISKYSWIHFEGRNEASLPSILQYLKEYNEKHASITYKGEEDKLLPNYKKVPIPISIEVEKHRPVLECLLQFAHVLLVGKDFALLQGAKDCVDSCKIISTKVPPGTVVITAWGDQGAAYCIARSNPAEVEVKKQDAYVPDKIIDSLGAGDTFNATVVHFLSKGRDIKTSVDLGCKIASQKLQMRGFKGLVNIAHKYN